MDKKDWKILVVDDEKEMRSLIADFLRDYEGYTVFEAENGDVALNLLKNHTIDLVLSDINMPKMKGFDLLNEIKKEYPHIKRILITAYNVEDYFELASKYDVGNIFVKTVPFNFDELSTVLTNLLTNNIFGLERYFSSSGIFKKFIVKKSRGLDVTANEIVSFIGNLSHPKKLELVIVELITNAIFYGIRKESAEYKDQWNYDFELSDNEAVVVVAAKDSEKYGISVTDAGGGLKKKDVLFWLNRQVSLSEDGLPIGIYDLHGRGLFITRKYIDRVIINIAQSQKTEVIIINYFNKSYAGYKPLYINEI